LKQLIDLWRATDKPPFGLDLPWTWRDIGKGYFLIVAACFIASSALFANQAGVFNFSEGNANRGVADGAFVLWVKNTGQTVYKDVPATITEEAEEYLLGTVFSDHDAAMDAVTGGEKLSGNPVYAHAVNVCYHGSGKASNETGGGRHLTWFRYHQNDRHYTTTAHQVLTQNGYLTTDTFRTSVSRNFCGC
jgi:hypothetical protein